MTQEEKELLIKDLCARAPYKFQYQVQYGERSPQTIKNILIDEDDVLFTLFDGWKVEEIKPYLRPMDSMTAEEKRECFSCISNAWNLTVSNQMDWLISHHFDFRGLIEKGLALPAKEGMYNN